jgi:hypothetical protein
MDTSSKRRDIDSRLEPSAAQKMKDIAAELSSLRIRGMASRVYINEIVDAIHGGLLLAAMGLSLSLLELWIRDLLSVHLAARSGAKTPYDFDAAIARFEREIEGFEKGSGPIKQSKAAKESSSGKLQRLSFRDMCEKLVDLQVLLQNESERLCSAYGKIRNPLHHGITGRTVDPSGDNLGLLEGEMTPEKWILAKVFAHASQNRADSFEDYVYETAPTLLREITDFLIKHPIPDLNSASFHTD